MSRFLIFTARQRDCDLLVDILRGENLETSPCGSAEELIGCLGEDTTALVTSEEMLKPAFVEQLRGAVERQPLWSELSIIVFTGADIDGNRVKHLDKLGPRASVTLLDRPIRIKTLVSIARATARARLRQYEVRDLLEKLEERIRERDRFLAILGHELRNPLSAIVLAAQMGDGDGKIEGQHAERIERQAQHLSRLVDDLLDHARVTAGKITLKRVHVDLNRLVEQCLKVLPGGRFRRDVDVSFEPSAEPLTLFVDPIRIDQIISNLLTNALKYTPEGGRIVVRTWKVGESAQLSVQDTGVGIAPDRIATVFDLFSQAENAIGRSEGGMGIGLNLVRTLVELHGGAVSAASPGLNQGSVFRVSVPLAIGGELHAGRGEAASSPYEESATKRIVVVDDNADIRDLLGIRLRKLGHTVTLAADGQTGLHRIISERPDVAVIDIGMAGLDGYQLAKRVRTELQDEIMLVALTGFGQAEDREQAIAAGFDVHLVKPIRSEDLQRILTTRPERPRPADDTT